MGAFLVKTLANRPAIGGKVADPFGVDGIHPARLEQAIGRRLDENVSQMDSMRSPDASFGSLLAAFRS